MNTWLVAAAVAIILGLAAYAGYLHWLLHRQRQATTRREAARAEGPRVGVVDPGAPDQQRRSRTRGLYLLADAILDDKLTHTEGCLRICAIAAGLDEHERFRLEYGVLFRVAEATAHIPILDAWQALPGDERKRYNRERMAVEDKYAEAVVEAARRLKEQYPLSPL